MPERVAIERYAVAVGGGGFHDELSVDLLPFEARTIAWFANLINDHATDVDITIRREADADA